MEMYESFASVYDDFMDNVPYDDWSTYLHGLLTEYGVKDGIILELGCGTGEITRRLKKAGYDMIGIDNSLSMLEIAKEKDDEGILYLLQDMREFELYGTVNAVVSICDSMNYITDEDDLLTVFKLVNNYLEKDGMFIFDMNTAYKYGTVIGDCTIADNREDASFIWENTFYEDENINEYELTLFIKNEEGLYEKSTELHYQKVYDLEVIKELLEKAGMKFVNAYDAFTHDAVREYSERIYIIAKEGYQENKYYGLHD